MPNHPNRSMHAPREKPTPAQIRAERERAGLTQSAAGALVHCNLRTWQQWEAEPGTPGHRSMHPAFWELFQIKTADMAVE